MIAVQDKAAIRRFVKLSDQLDKSGVKGTEGIDWYASCHRADLRCTNSHVAARLTAQLAEPLVYPAQGHGLWTRGTLTKISDLPDAVYGAPSPRDFDVDDLIPILRALRAKDTIHLTRSERHLLFGSGPLDPTCALDCAEGPPWAASVNPRYLMWALATYGPGASIGLHATDQSHLTLYSPQLAIVIAQTRR